MKLYNDHQMTGNSLSEAEPFSCPHSGARGSLWAYSSQLFSNFDHCCISPNAVSFIFLWSLLFLHLQLLCWSYGCTLHIQGLRSIMWNRSSRSAEEFTAGPKRVESWRKIKSSWNIKSQVTEEVQVQNPQNPWQLSPLLKVHTEAVTY